MTASRRAAAASMVAVLVVCGLYAVRPPAKGREFFVDHVINRQTVDAMRSGEGYYEAMDDALREHVGPASSVRAFRMPTAFLVWRWLPGAHARWLVYVAMVLVVCACLVSATTAPWIVPGVALHLLRFGRPHDAAGWIDQYLLVELWTLPAIAGAFLAWRRGRPALAAVLAVVATAVRELAALLVVGLVIGAVFRSSRRRPAVVAVAAVVVLVVAHAVFAGPQLADRGTEAPLLGTGGLDRVFTMAGVGLPRPDVVGGIVWVVALWWVFHDHDLRPFLAPLLLLPAIGLFVGRDYWGLLVVPLELVAAGEVAAMLAARVAARPIRAR